MMVPLEGLDGLRLGDVGAGCLPVGAGHGETFVSREALAKVSQGTLGFRIELD